MKSLMGLIAVILVGINASAEKINCQIKLSTKLVSEQGLDLPDKASASFGNIPGYSFKILNQGASKFTVEIFEADAPARHYVAGNLRAVADQLNWALWTRDILIETSCFLSSAIRH